MVILIYNSCCKSYASLLSVKENANFITEYDHNNDGVIKFLQNFLK